MNNKMKQYIKSIVSLIVFCLFVSCSDGQEDILSGDKNIPAGMGMVDLKVKSNTTIDIPTINTKAEHKFDMDPTTFPLVIYSKSGETYTKVKEYESYTALVNEGLPLQLPIGTYKIVASSFIPGEAKVTKDVYFEGSTDFIVEEKRVSNVSVVCNYASLAVELRLSEQFQHLLDTDPLNYAFEMDVYNGIKGIKWSFSQSKEDEKETVKNLDTGYFLDGCTAEQKKLMVKVRVRLNSSNKWYPERTYYFDNNGNTPKVGEYYVITLDAGPKTKTLVRASKYGNSQKEADK